MNREYYNLWFRLDARDAYLIWFHGDPDDGLVTDENGKIPCFLNIEDLLRYASALEFTIKTEDQKLLDLDLLVAWLELKETKTVDCVTFLDAWNLFIDISETVVGNFDSEHRKTKKIYEKLFWGNNIPAVTPEGESYTPTWTKRELKIMGKVLEDGLLMLREKTNCV